MKKKVFLAYSLSLPLITMGVLLLLRPAIWSFMAIGTAGEIGALIGGVTAVVVGTLNAVLLYITLQNQITRDERQTIESHYDRINDMIERFTFKKYVEEPGATGSEALSQVAHELRPGDSSMQELIVGEAVVDYLWLILFEFNSFSERLSHSRIADEEKLTLRRRLLLLYRVKLSGPFTGISRSRLMRERHPDFLERAQKIEAQIEVMLQELGSAPSKKARIRGIKHLENDGKES